MEELRLVLEGASISNLNTRLYQAAAHCLADGYVGRLSVEEDRGMNGPDAPNLSPTVPVLPLNPNPEISTDSSVHLFTLGNHTVAHGVRDVGPATIVLEETVSAAVPAE